MSLPALLPALPWTAYLPPLRPAWAAIAVFAVAVALAVAATVVGARLTAMSGIGQTGDAAGRCYGVAAVLYAVALGALAAGMVLS